jgi:hypothetical protein
MTALAELLALVDGLDETGPNFREVREIKRAAHTVEAEQAAK